ncbi:MAG: PilZ domain-containing protein [Deltaproteobacteria bacterium]|nr:MAG: PilZ domain-containing protein [Deltaproteobacteria bacterium]
MSIEKRLHPRILVEWPAAVKTLKGTIEGITKDISVDGVFIFCPEEPALENSFAIALEPTGERFIAVYGERVWSGNSIIDDRTVFGMGIRFTFMAPEDRQHIASLVEKERNE